uniref:Large ribosomal subunit protein uL22m n=1 Tax=Mesocestoides corti TaxID=53468 RepID=A0A5K3EVI8_MESCO
MNLQTLSVRNQLGRIFCFLHVRKKCFIPGIQHQPFRGFAKGTSRDQDMTMTSRLTGKKTKLWELYNEVIYPPSEPTNEGFVEKSQQLRPAEITYTKDNILYSQKKLWLLAFMIRGLSVDEAFQQLGFRPEKGARILENALEAAIEKAVVEQDVEFCTDLWIEKTLVLRGLAVPRIHKGLRTNISTSNYHYARLMLRLREGRPPVLYHPYRIRSSWHPEPNCPAGGASGWGTADDILDIQIRKLRRRRIPGEL